MEGIIKYPRTKHLEGSKIQKGDEDLKKISFNIIKGKHIVIEEKIDGANTAISFDQNKTLLLQSRGHYLTGGIEKDITIYLKSGHMNIKKNCIIF